MYVIPKTDFVVRDPITKRALPSTGAEVPANSYWQRRLRDGDVALGSVPAAEPAVPAKPAAPTSTLITGASEA